MTKGAGSWLRLLTGLLVAMLSFSAAALNCATPGKDGAGVNLNGVINSYWPGTVSAGAGTTSISLGPLSGAGTGIAVGDLLLVIQMQDAAIDSSNSSAYGDGSSGSGSTALNNAGLYEFVRATSAVTSGNATVTIVGGGGSGLLNNYTNADASIAQGQRRFQVVRVPQYTSASIISELTAAAWNGSSGGVLAFDVAGQLTLSSGATVNVNGLGFRGGAARPLKGIGKTKGFNGTDYRTLATDSTNGSKGEGIAGTPRYVNGGGTSPVNTGIEGYPNGSHARGAPGNAGGGGTDGNPDANDQNTGGGGGSNAGRGGKGGNPWSTLLSYGGGLGGSAYSPGPGRLFLGGGGGSGTTNDGTGSPGSGFASSGAPGGGMVMIRAGRITGSGTISANGISANGSVLNDGSGGGGAGGSVLVYSGADSVGSLTIQANGGKGGTNTGGSTPPAHGPGGGGSGGFVVTSATVSASINFNGGAAGTTVVNTDNFGATPGNSGTSAALSSSQIPGVSSGSECSPSLVFLKTVSASYDPFNLTNNPKNIPGAEVLYTLRVTNTGFGKVDTGTIVITDLIPANTELFLGDLGTANSGPIEFTAATSALTWSYGGLNNASDDVGFYSNIGCTILIPTLTAPYGSTVNCIRFNPKGVMAAASATSNPYFELKFRVRIK